MFDYNGNAINSTSNALNNYITNGSTTNTTISGYTSGNVGLSTYQILPKIKSFCMAGANGNTTAAADTILGGLTNTTLTTAINFSIAYPRVHYFWSPTGATAGRVIKYTYIDASGNEQTTTQTITSLNTYYATPSAVSINEFKITGNNLALTSADLVQLSLINSTSTLFMGSINGIRQSYCGVFTCPNNAIAMITNFDATLGTAFDYYNLNIWDKDGNRFNAATYTVWNNAISNIHTAGGGDYASLGRILTAGESCCFSTTTTNSTIKSVYYNVLVRYF